MAPGETIYMPSYIPHSVYNLDETVAVGDNPFFGTSIEESAFLLHNHKAVNFAKIDELHGIQVARGQLQITLYNKNKDI